MHPKSDPSAPSSDLERARAAAARLVASRSARAAAAEIAPPRFAKLRPRERDAGAPPAADLAEPEWDLSAIESAGERAWNAYLDWAIASGPADGAFFADDHGLVIAARGTLPTDDLESAATRFVLALDQAAMVDPASAGTPTVVVDAKERWWTGLYVARSIVLVLVGRSPVPRSRASRIAEALARAVEGLER